MHFIGIDLGSTNTKAALYDQHLREVAAVSRPLAYDRRDGLVEFDITAYLANLFDMLSELVRQSAVPAADIAQIALTGQAESLVILDQAGQPLMAAISWMDERSVAECRELQRLFPAELCRQKTGQLAVLPTWPATKIRWLQHNRPEVHRQAARYVLLKDYVAYGLTGRLLADLSIATFSFYTDIYAKQYWPEMLRACGIQACQLPPLSEPCTTAGLLSAEAAARTGLTTWTQVNLGTLDHFAGMIGTGNLAAGDISLSIGTVTALAALVPSAQPGQPGIAMHYGFRPDTRIMLAVAESGGFSLEWFKQACLPQAGYDEINRTLAQRNTAADDLIFLPYLTGANAPEYDTDTCGLFYGLRAGHDAFDMAGAVMAGVACLIRRNCEAIRAAGTTVERLIVTGGGAKSPVWSQLLADICGVPVDIPVQQEAATLGAAIIGAVSAGLYPDYEAAVRTAVAIRKRVQPHVDPVWQKKYRQFLALYEAMKRVRSMA